jgi:hypothetical protein
MEILLRSMVKLEDAISHFMRLIHDSFASRTPPPYLMIISTTEIEPSAKIRASLHQCFA